MLTDTIKLIEINWKVLNTINDNRSITGSTEVVIESSDFMRNVFWLASCFSKTSR